MGTGLSRALLRLARNHPVSATGFLSVLPAALHRHWIVRQMLSDMSGLHLTVKARLTNGMRVKIPVGDEVGNEIYTSGISEGSTVRLLASLVDKDTVFFDVGAHIGQYTLLAAPLAREVHCFEPMPWIFDMLGRNIFLNKLSNVFSNPTGVRDYSGWADVWEGPKENSGSGSFLRIPGYYERSHPVRCVTLDDYCERTGLALQRRKLLIKIDVERAELEVLRGAARLFRYEPTVIIEFNDWSTDLEGIMDFFEERKYSLKAITNSGLQEQFTIDQLFPQRRQSKAINILAEPPKSVRELTPMVLPNLA